MKYIYLFVSFVLLLSCNCHSPQNNMTNKSLYNSKLHKLGKSKYGKECQFDSNENDSFIVLYIDVPRRKNDPVPTLHFSIYDRSNEVIIFEDVVPGGTFSWSGKRVVVINKNIGRMKDLHNKKSNILYRYDVRNKKKLNSGFINLKQNKSIHN